MDAASSAGHDSGLAPLRSESAGLTAASTRFGARRSPYAVDRLGGAIDQAVG